MIEIRHPRMDDTSRTREAYNRIYKEEGILLRDSFYLWLISLLKPKPGSVLVDISCGQGRLVSFASWQGIKAIGIDFAFEAIRRGIAESPESGWIVADGEQIPLASESADCVMHIGSLEHYQNPEAGMREIARILKPNGVACVFLPNSFGLFGNIEFVLQTGDVFDDGQPLQRYNTRQGWHNLLAANGLSPFKTLGYETEMPRTIKDLRWYLRQPVKIIRLLVGRVVPINLAIFLVYLCRRNSNCRQVELLNDENAVA